MRFHTAIEMFQGSYEPLKVTGIKCNLLVIILRFIILRRQYNASSITLRYTNVEYNQNLCSNGKSYKGKYSYIKGIAEMEGVVVHRLLILIAVDTEKSE